MEIDWVTVDDDDDDDDDEDLVGGGDNHNNSNIHTGPTAGTNDGMQGIDVNTTSQSS
jgi:hypothetical protein